MVQLEAQKKVIENENELLDIQEAKFSQLTSINKANNEMQPESEGNTNEIQDFDANLVQELQNMLSKHYEQLCLANKQDIYSKTYYDLLMRSNVTCWRYLIQRDKNLMEAFQLIDQALIWRKREQIDQLSAKSLIKEFWLKASLGFVGKTRNGNDLMYIVGKNYRKPGSNEVKTMIRRMVTYLLIDWDSRHSNSMEQFVVVFDVYETTFSNLDLEFISWLISIIDFLPARFYAIHVIGIPFLLRPFIRLAISWLSDRYGRICHCGTREELEADVVDENNLPFEVNGCAPDTWRLAPLDAPWSKDCDTFSEQSLKELDECVCFNTTKQRIDELIGMQLKHENSINS